jgi:hypothetical protein
MPSNWTEICQWRILNGKREMVRMLWMDSNPEPSRRYRVSILGTTKLRQHADEIDLIQPQKVYAGALDGLLPIL